MIRQRHNFNRILFATDLSAFANNAFPFAVRFAQIYKADLYLLHVIAMKSHDDGNDLDSETIKQSKISAFRELEDQIKQTNIHKHRVFFRVIVASSAAEGILTFIEDNKIDLVVLGTYGEGWQGPFFLGSVAERIPRHAPCPVLTINKKNNEDIANILVPIDFSDYSKNALRLAKYLAKKYEARLSLLHVVEYGAYPSFYDMHDYDLAKIVSRIKNKSPNVLKKLLNDTPGPKVDADLYVVIGQAAYQIIKFIDDYDPDLVVISSHGLSDIDYFLLGSVTDKVIKRANCPVLSIK